MAVSVQRSSKLWCSSTSSDIGNDETKKTVAEEDLDEILGEKKDSHFQAQTVDPRRGWGFRGVHKAIICGKVGQAPVQKILRNGRTVTIFTVGTGGMFDQRIEGAKDLPRPAQWHRIAVHNEALGAYAVNCSSSIYVEGDIETRVYNDSINGEVKNIPEICVRYDVYPWMICEKNWFSKQLIGTSWKTLSLGKESSSSHFCRKHITLATLGNECPTAPRKANET
ncbi:mitochondrially targeted single-stranded DNA binding protein [Prunus dulcis]|uniref:Mitochondrially targeted single-stranded DNA binding protein n=1 Tax=Prunus dulcis TaxID=3755 RepID=A0A4Y1RQF9_PRUDU|nr:mitochondrially targeted single-stranded DNA binding protein [Prunus dulcis]